MTFSPMWASPPGDTIAALLQQKRIPRANFAEEFSTPSADDLLNGRAEISPEIATRLANLLGGSPRFWLNRQQQYQAATAVSSEERDSWLRSLPLRDMFKRGWLAKEATAEAQFRTVLRYFDVDSLFEWRRVQERAAVAFRESKSFQSEASSVAVWLRRAEMEAEQIPCAPWDRDQFVRSLQQVRTLTNSKNGVFVLETLRTLCAASGVAFVAVEAPHGCRASGAATFVDDGKALIALSFRTRADDQFWFSFFHEAGHLALHSRDSIFIDSEDRDEPSDIEREANEFAAATLLPGEFREELLRVELSTHSILRFSQRAGISAAVVVGQLQHHHRVPRNYFNELRYRCRWPSSP